MDLTFYPLSLLNFLNGNDLKDTAKLKELDLSSIGIICHKLPLLFIHLFCFYDIVDKVFQGLR